MIRVAVALGGIAVIAACLIVTLVAFDPAPRTRSTSAR